MLTSQTGYEVATGEEHSALGLITGGAGSDTISADKGILAGNEGDDSPRGVPTKLFLLVEESPMPTFHSPGITAI